jgi:hypothetical protein
VEKGTCDLSERQGPEKGKQLEASRGCESPVNIVPEGREGRDHGHCYEVEHMGLESQLRP